MKEKETKIGRPTEAKKDITIKVRIDDETQKMINFCAERMNLSKSEIVRLGIIKVYQESKGDN